MDTGRRWLAVGHSAASDPRQAGREATRGALEGTDPALLVIFSSGPDPEGLLAGIEDVCPGVPLIGCASQALIASPGPPGPAYTPFILGRYPGPEHTVFMKPEELERFKEMTGWKKKA